MEVVRYAVIVAWTETGEKAYSLLGLDDDYKPVAIEPVYVGNASQVDMLRHWLNKVNGQREQGQQAIVFTNMKAARQKSAHVMDFEHIHVKYSSEFTRKYAMAMQVALDTAKKGEDRT
ncbi:hypothetical protein [Sporosarcina aquimarina]|uniref:Uncharacterized protein n=1 Tax=Sporosarcina aquimarina TaxID=114975 RepID=A0ABU4G0E8_9BACL|nr:hypothetical protein [Sporosarcina aquimarina]MDW0110451.1 hypothetical protein [Sporosarcina aquimarina]